jgi:RNA polymerase sigma-70 factor (ECF subfamily)
MGFPGRQAKMQSLVDEHYQALYRYAYRLSGTVTDAEDLVQETFCRAQEKLSQLRDPERAKAWLFSILRNGYLHRLRTNQHPHLVPLHDMGDFAEPPESLPEVEPQKLQEALNELPEVFRTPVIMFYFEEFSYRDIAELMEVPLGTVMSRLARAKAQLRGRLFPPAAAVVEGRGRRSGGL